MRGKYIFYVFNTLTWTHIEMALESIVRQDFYEHMAFTLYNVSSFDSAKILALAMDKCERKFHSYSYWSVNYESNSTIQDINNIVYGTERDCDADWYIVHKADFYLGRDSLRNAHSRLQTTDPVFLNFCKFDLREKIVGDEVRELARLSFDDIMTLPGATDLTTSAPPDWGVHYDKIGYRGIDGVMHGYTEAARKLLVFNTFIEQQTVDENISYGVEWIYGDCNVYALHMFHELPYGRNPEKDIVGYRF